MLGAIVSYWVCRSEALKFTALSFTAGLLLVTGVEHMASEAHAAAEDSYASTAAFVAGFACFTLLSGYFA